MNEKEAYQNLAERFGITLEMVPFFIETFRDHTIINPLTEKSARRIGRLLELKPGKKVLDLACGKAGVSLPMVFAYKVELLGVDILPDFIREAWSRAEASGLYHLCDFITENAAQFTAETRRKWDAVLMLGASPVWGGLKGCLESLPPLAAPGGYLVIGEPYYHYHADRDPKQPFLSQDETTRIIETAGEIVEIIDDGKEGWKAYIEPGEKIGQKLKEDNPDNTALHLFLDERKKEHDWERENLGWAVWVLKGLR